MHDDIATDHDVFKPNVSPMDTLSDLLLALRLSKKGSNDPDVRSLPMLTVLNMAKHGSHLSPIDRLMLDLHAIGSSLVDFRDLDEWPRTRGPGWIKPGDRDSTGKLWKYGRQVYGPENKKYDPEIYGYPDKSRAVHHGERSWNQLTTVMVHTAAARLHANRFLGVPAQAGVSTETEGMPKCVLMHNLLRKLHHGDSANGFTWGIEISGFMDWDHPAQFAIVCALLRYFKASRQEAAGLGAPFYLMPHRFSDGTSKALDPGWAIWTMTCAYAESIGYQLGPVLRGGKPLPFQRVPSKFSEPDFAQYMVPSLR